MSLVIDYNDNSWTLLWPRRLLVDLKNKTNSKVWFRYTLIIKIHSWTDLILYGPFDSFVIKTHTETLSQTSPLLVHSDLSWSTLLFRISTCPRQLKRPLDVSFFSLSPLFVFPLTQLDKRIWRVGYVRSCVWSSVDPTVQKPESDSVNVVEGTKRPELDSVDGHRSQRSNVWQYPEGSEIFKYSVRGII